VSQVVRINAKENALTISSGRISLHRHEAAWGQISNTSDNIGKICIIREDALDTHPLGSQAIGQCQADDALFGCFAEVREGRVQQGLCVD